jgi:YgiT-type zinc finger domain-containing protein
MGNGSEDKGEIAHEMPNVWDILYPTTTDLPFKVSHGTIVILKHLPVVQCEGCSEYLIADAVFANAGRTSVVDSTGDRQALDPTRRAGQDNADWSRRRQLWQ